MSCALINHWVNLHNIDMDLNDQADRFAGVHIVSIVMCLGKVETAPKQAGRVARVKLDDHTDVKPKHPGKAECTVGIHGKQINT